MNGYAELPETTGQMVADVLAEAFPYDGPYSGERSIEAARLVDQLLRFLANATWQPSSLPAPPAVYNFLGDFKAGMWKVPQLLGQVAALLEKHAADPRLTLSEFAEPGSDPAADALTAAAELEAAAGTLQPLLDSLERAQQHLSRLYFAGDRR